MRQHLGPARLPTQTQLAIMRLALGGHTNRAIGLRLGFTEKTVKNYMSIIFDLLHVNCRIDMVTAGIRDGYLACPCGHSPIRPQRLKRPASSVEPAHVHHRRTA